MTIKTALERIFWRFKSIKGNETDQETLNTLAEFVNDKHTKQLQDNEMFAKVYIFMYSYFLKRYDTDIYDSIPQKELHRYLDQPLERIVTRFKDKLNEKEYELQGTIVHPAIGKSTSKFKEVWDYETVKEHLELMINMAINQFKTLKQ